MSPREFAQALHDGRERESAGVLKVLGPTLFLYFVLMVVAHGAVPVPYILLTLLTTYPWLHSVVSLPLNTPIPYISLYTHHANHYTHNT